MKSSKNTIAWGLDLFLSEEKGYTSLSVGLALALSLVLLFGLVCVQWSSSKAAEVQNVADAAALSGAQSVKAFTTVAQVSDASVLTLGLTGMLVMGAGLITSAVPGLQGPGAALSQAGSKILHARREFAKTAAAGLQKLEGLLPCAIAANGVATAGANSKESHSYLGVAIPFPETSQSHYDLADALDEHEVEEKNAALAEKSAEAEKAKKEMQDSLERAWRADCIDDPYCMHSRAASLAGLAPAQNPFYATPDTWSFGAPLLRSRAYYGARAAAEASSSTSVEEQANSAMRKAFYTFATAEMNKGFYTEKPDGSVSMSLPDLPHNTEETRTSTLFSEVQWPKSQEGDTFSLHAYAGCPGAAQIAGTATLQESEALAYALCPYCQFSVQAMGKTASASTNINNGYEHYWKIVVEESKRWQQARDSYQKYQQEIKDLSTQAADAFDKTIQALGVSRPVLCPPGAWGVVGVALRPESDLPQKLKTAFSTTQALPTGIAVAGAVLATDEATTQNNILARFFDATKASEATPDDDFEGALGALFGGITGLWSTLLASYQEGFEKVSEAGSTFFDGLKAVGAAPLAAWLSRKLSSIVSALGLEPADLRLRKPVLCNTKDIFKKSGLDIESLAHAVQALPTAGSWQELLASFSRQLGEMLESDELVIAELPIPGTGQSIPFSISVKKLLGVL